MRNRIRQLRDQVGRVVRLHFVEDVGGASSLQCGHDLHAVIITEFFEHVGQSVFRQFLSDRELAVSGQVMQEVRQVSCLHVLGVLDECGGGLVGVGNEESGGLWNIDGQGFASAAESQRVEALTLDVQFGEHPVTRATLLHRHVEDFSFAAAIVHCDDAVEELGNDECFSWPLIEAAQIQQARDDNSSGFDGGDASERQEDPATRSDLDDEADDVRRGLESHGHDDVMDGANFFTQRVKNA